MSRDEPYNLMRYVLPHWEAMYSIYHFSIYILGNEVHISVCTDTEYEKREGTNHFGLKCQLVGYEWTSDPREVHIYMYQINHEHFNLCIIKPLTVRCC